MNSYDAMLTDCQQIYTDYLNYAADINHTSVQGNSSVNGNLYESWQNHSKTSFPNDDRSSNQNSLRLSGRSTSFPSIINNSAASAHNYSDSLMGIDPGSLLSNVEQMLASLATEIHNQSEAGSNTLLLEKMKEDLQRMREDLTVRNS